MKKLMLMMMVMMFLVGCGSDDSVNSVTNTEQTEEQEEVITTEVEEETTHSHTYVESITQEATCEANGVKTFTCECGDCYTEDITAKGHSYGEYVYNNDATTEADGTETATCSLCGGKNTRTKEGTRKEIVSAVPETPTTSTSETTVGGESSDDTTTGSNIGPGGWDDGPSYFIEVNGYTIEVLPNAHKDFVELETQLAYADYNTIVVVGNRAAMKIPNCEPTTWMNADIQLCDYIKSLGCTPTHGSCNQLGINSNDFYAIEYFE